MNKFWQGPDWARKRHNDFRLTDQKFGSQGLDNSDPQGLYSTKQPARYVTQMSYKYRGY